MHSRQVICFVLITLGLVGCQKEYSLETESAPPVSGTGLLEKVVLKNTVSEINYLYEYNSSGLAARNIFSLTTTSFSADGIFQATRDAGGKIQKSSMVLSSSATNKPDTLNFEMKRNASGKISYVIAVFADTTNTAGYDSIVYSYNTAGKLAGWITYLVEYGAGGAAIPIQRMEMTWTGNNVTKSVEYELEGSLTASKLIETVTYFYDAKPAARVLTEDDFIAGLGPANNIVPAENNTVKYLSEYAQTPEDNVITEYNYVYGADGRPSTAEVTTIRPGIPASKASMTFTYR